MSQIGAAALELGWHHIWHFQGAVGWHGLTGWAGQPMGEKGKLWDTVVEVKATKKLRRSQSGFSSINQSSKIPSREKGNGLAPGQPPQKMPCSPSASEVRETHTDPPKSCPLERRNQPRGRRTGT